MFIFLSFVFGITAIILAVKYRRLKDDVRDNEAYYENLVKRYEPQVQADALKDRLPDEPVTDPPSGDISELIEALQEAGYVVTCIVPPVDNPVQEPEPVSETGESTEPEVPPEPSKPASQKKTTARKKAGKEKDKS